MRKGYLYNLRKKMKDTVHNNNDTACTFSCDICKIKCGIFDCEHVREEKKKRGLCYWDIKSDRERININIGLYGRYAEKELNNLNHKCFTKQNIQKIRKMYYLEKEYYNFIRSNINNIIVEQKEVDSYYGGNMVDTQYMYLMYLNGIIIDYTIVKNRQVDPFFYRYYTFDKTFEKRYL